jgi:hypothetical protein
MEINGVNPQSAHARQLVKMHSKDQQAVEEPDQTPAGEGPSEPAPAAVEQTTEDTNDKDTLQLLVQGHFKGVADVRLRINFYNELAAIEAQQLQAVADEQIDGILQSVGSIVGTLLEESVPPPESTLVLLPPPPSPTTPLPQQPPSPVLLPPPPPPTTPLPQPAPPPVPILAPSSPSDDGVINLVRAITVKITIPTNEPPPPPPPDIAQLQETFTQTVNQLKDDFLTAEAPSTGTLVEGIQSAFDELVDGLESALAPETDDTPVVGIGADILEPAAASELEPDLQAVIADLRAAFEAAMDGLINGFGEVTILSVVSEPTGNGAAYQKFLDIYNEMRGVDTTDADSEAPQLVDAQG